jgi:hypothetical protein
MSNVNQKPIIVSTGGNAKYIALGVLTLGGYFFYKKWNDDRLLKQNNTQAAEDNSANLASQIHAENRATYTEDSVQLGLFRQITDYKKTQDSYLKASGGKDMLEDTRKHVSSGAYQQILNILGIKGGAIKATSQAATDVQSNPNKPSWVVAKVDARIRKTPKAGSAVFTLRPNIIGTAKGNTLIGFVDQATLKKNGGKLFYDDENSVFFLPVFVFDDKNMRRYYTAYVAVSTVNIYKDQPKTLPFFRVSESAYTQAYATSGIERSSELDGLTDVSKLMI